MAQSTLIAAGETNMPTALKYAVVAIVAMLIGGLVSRLIGATAGGQGESSPKSLSGAPSELTIEVLAVDGMACQSCVQSITSALKELPGVLAVQVSLRAKRAIVAADPTRVNASQLAAAVVAAGYQAAPVSAEADSQEVSQQQKSAKQ